MRGASSGPMTPTDWPAVDTNNSATVFARYEVESPALPRPMPWSEASSSTR